MSFYEKKENFDRNMDSISKKSLTTLRGQKWSEEKIAAFMQYQVESRNCFTPLESDLDDKFEEMWRIEHLLDVSTDDSLRSNDEREEQQQTKVAQTSGRTKQVGGEARETTLKTSQEVEKKQGKVYIAK